MAVYSMLYEIIKATPIHHFPIYYSPLTIPSPITSARQQFNISTVSLQPMKWLTLIFALYLLLLSCVPCMCDDIKTSDTTRDTKTNNPAKKKNNDDNCTPFCTCTCCPAPAFFHIKADYNTNKPTAFINPMHFTLVDKDYSSYNCHNIWQPPKLSC